MDSPLVALISLRSSPVIFLCGTYINVTPLSLKRHRFEAVGISRSERTANVVKSASPWEKLVQRS